MLNILLVDDSRVTREVTKVYLVADGVTLHDATDGEDALRVIRRSPPDLVLADMNMPKLDGPGLCEQMQADPALSKIPVIILTSRKDAASRERCLLAGARDVLTKPVQPGDLLYSVKRQLHR